jgi:hypothetical protein
VTTPGIKCPRCGWTGGAHELVHAERASHWFDRLLQWFMAGDRCPKCKTKVIYE